MNMDRDILICRVTDGVASAADWEALQQLGAADATIWHELAESQRQHLLLSAATGAEIDRAIRSRAVRDELFAVPGSRLRLVFPQRLNAWLGWAAAAVLALALFKPALPREDTGDPGRIATAGPALDLNSYAPAALLNAYLDRGLAEGTVVGEVPNPVLVEKRPAPDGQGYDIVFVRQIVEKARVQDGYRFSQDELGQPVPVRVRFVANAKNPL